MARGELSRFSRRCSAALALAAAALSVRGRLGMPTGGDAGGPARVQPEHVINSLLKGQNKVARKLATAAVSCCTCA